MDLETKWQHIVLSLNVDENILLALLLSLLYNGLIQLSGM